MKDIIIIQHCQSEHHINGLVGGWTDTPLTEAGRVQAGAVAERLRGEVEGKPFHLYASDLLRAAQTAEIIAGRLGLEVTPAPGIREVNNGIEAGKTREWAKQHSLPHPKEKTLDFSPCEGAETWREFYHRTTQALEAIEREGHEHVMLVTHGGALSNIVAWWLRLPVEVLAGARFFGNPGGITRLGEDRRGMRFMSSFNDMHHLEKLQMP